MTDVFVMVCLVVTIGVAGGVIWFVEEGMK